MFLLSRHLKWCFIWMWFCGSGSADTYISPYIYLEKVKAALDEFKDDCGHYPEQSAGLKQLLESNKPCWQGPYMIERFLNGYLNRPIKYVLKMVQGKQQLYLSTYGEDLWWGTADDIRLSDDVNTRRLKFERIINQKKLKKELKILMYFLGFYLVLSLIIYVIISLLSRIGRVLSLYLFKK